MFASPSPMANPMLMRPDPIRPQPLDLVQAFVPECVVYLSADALGTDFRAASGDASRATVVFAAHHPIREIEGRVDAHCGPGELPDLIDDFVAHRAPQAPVQVAHIEPVETTPGLTSVIIPVFNRWELTKACLESLKRHTVLPFEIIVVDNGSTDKTPRRLGHTSARVITNQENLGFPKAVNQGLAASRGEFVCILNNDTQVTTGWLEALLTALDIPGTGLVGPRTNEIGGLQKVPDAPGPDRGVAAHAWARRWVEERTGRTWITDRLVGFCLMARRRTIERVGAFDEGFGMGNFEDDELGRRVMAAGMTLRVADDAFVLHHGSATFKAMAIDYQAALHRAARHLRDRPDSSTATTTALILSDGDTIGAATSAATALMVADEVRVIERTAQASTELAIKILAGGSIDVVGLDWSGADGAAAAMENVGSGLALVMEAGERLDVEDWGRARADLDAVGDEAIAISTPSGFETRVLPPSPDAVGLVGGTGSRHIHSFSVSRPPAG